MADDPNLPLGLLSPPDAIDAAATQYGLNPAVLKGIASIESSMNPESNRDRATQYKGLFQMGGNEWKQYGGGGDIYNARDNANAAAKMLADHAQWFNNQYGREPSPAELYMMHQQGRGFFKNGTMTNVAGNPFPGMRGPQTPQSFAQGWGDTLIRRMAPFGGASSIYANANANPAASAVAAGPPMPTLQGIGPEAPVGQPPGTAVGAMASGGPPPGAPSPGAAPVSSLDQLMALVKGAKADEPKASPLVDLGKQVMTAAAKQPQFPFTPQPLAPANTGPFRPLPLNLPKFLAEGGIVDRPTLAVIGEAGPEAVVPLSPGDEADAARQAAALRTRQGVQPAGGRQEGVPTEVLNAIRASFVRSAMAGPRAMGKVFSGELDPMSPEGIAAARDIAIQGLSQSPFAVRGSLGAGGGKMMQPTEKGLAVSDFVEPARPANSNYGLPEPLSFKDRIWQNYTRRMSPEEALQSEAIWSGAKQLAKERGIPESHAFAELANDYFARGGHNRFMTPEVARRFMGEARGIFAYPRS
jgi:hypothetical protein